MRNVLPASKEMLFTSHYAYLYGISCNITCSCKIWHFKQAFPNENSRPSPITLNAPFNEDHKFQNSMMNFHNLQTINIT